MLGLYLDTFIIGHTFFSMLSKLNKLPSQKGLQYVTTYIVFWTIINKTTTTIKTKPNL